MWHVANVVWRLSRISFKDVCYSSCGNDLDENVYCGVVFIITVSLLIALHNGRCFTEQFLYNPKLLSGFKQLASPTSLSGSAFLRKRSSFIGVRLIHVVNFLKNWMELTPKQRLHSSSECHVCKRYKTLKKSSRRLSCLVTPGFFFKPQPSRWNGRTYVVFFTIEVLHKWSFSL